MRAEPHRDRSKENNAPRAQNEFRHTRSRGAENAVKMRHSVFRKLAGIFASSAAKRRQPFKQQTGRRDGKHTGSISRRRKVPRRTEKHTGYHRRNGQLCPAWDKRCGNGGNAPFAAVFYRACRHYAGNSAAAADKQRHKRIPGKAERSEQPVGKKSRTRGISAFLHQRKQREKHKHLRQIAHHRKHPRRRSVHGKRDHRRRSARTRKKRAQNLRQSFYKNAAHIYAFVENTVS